MKRLTLILAALALFAAARAPALELSLEENRGESGTIGYVDIDRVFKGFSGTSNAREEFLAEIKTKEDALNLKKQAIFSLKADIAKLKQEREFALTLPGLMRQAEEISAAAALAAEDPGPQISTQTAQAANPQISTPTTAVQLSTQTAQAASTQVSAADDARETAGIGKGIGREQQVERTQGKEQVSYSALTSTSTFPTPPPAVEAPPAGLPGLAGIDMPGISRVPVNYFKFSISTSAAEIDSVITVKEAELSKKEEKLLLSQRQTERELLEYETHKSEIILGRIYLALKELAVKEGVSVIVDKRNILFGHSAVDLTDKLIKKLEESPI